MANLDEHEVFERDGQRLARATSRIFPQTPAGAAVAGEPGR